ncbi:PadR family transcriptional regulator [Roseibium aestuarii]|uniref:PadR family transcriptional regulator n=1 Tax=Roseibium aestuarii TaxID=2600299 RepID=A0ABW4JSP4_9HYPH|nr:PadR family transcriptional regulator [Roseibium aestuarii]
MSVRSLCLAILSFGEATGYEIRKESTSGRFSYFDDASYGSIYPTLAKLEREGLVSLREEPQRGKPTRKIYAITEAGRAALVEELREPPEPDRFRSPFLLTALCAENLDRDTLSMAIARRRQHLNDELAILQAHDGDCDHGPSRWTRAFGIACMEFSLAYLAQHGDELLAMAGRESPAPLVRDERRDHAAAPSSSSPVNTAGSPAQAAE